MIYWPAFWITLAIVLVAVIGARVLFPILAGVSEWSSARNVPRSLSLILLLTIIVVVIVGIPLAVGMLAGFTPGS